MQHFRYVRRSEISWVFVHGDLIDIELLAKSRQEWLALSPNDPQSVIDKVAPETIPWPVSSKQL
jgi:hypothetical protein